MNDFLVALLVYSIRDGLLLSVLCWVVVRLVRGLAPPPVVPVVPGPPAPGPQPVPGPVPGKPPVVVPAAGKPRFTGIATTDFSGRGDRETSAYDGKVINGDTEFAAALPAHGMGGKVVRVFYNGKSVDCPVRDVGPWNGLTKTTDDPYWQTGTRPQAETGTDLSGRKTNLAGLDISPAAWKALGYVGDPTKATEKTDWDFVDYLDAAAPSPPTLTGEPAWLTAARAEIGFHEQPDNTGIEKYVTGAGFGAEHQPWCAIFAAWAFHEAGVPTPGVNAMARSFATSPGFTPLSAPRMGCPAVFWRGSKSGGEGHVGFYVGEDATHVQVLGGNESDMVKIEPIPKNGNSMGLLGYWWPVQSATPSAAEPKLT